VAKWWLPDAIEFVEALPHGATGKVLKTALRERFAGYQLHEPLQPADSGVRAPAPMPVHSNLEK